MRRRKKLIDFFFLFNFATCETSDFYVFTWFILFSSKTKMKSKPSFLFLKMAHRSEHILIKDFYCWAGSVSCNNKQFAVASPDSDVVKVIESATETFDLAGHERKVVFLIYSPTDPHALLSCSYDTTARLWSTEKRKCTKVFRSKAPVTCAAFSPDGSEIATGHYHGSISLWSEAHGQLCTFSHGPSHITHLQYTPDSLYLVSATFNQGIQFWFRPKMQRAMTLFFLGDAQCIRSFSFLKSGETYSLAVGHTDGVRIWEVSRSKAADTLVNFPPNTTPINTVRHVPYSDGERLVYFSKDTVGHVCGTKKGNILQTFTGVNYISCFPNGHQVLATRGESGVAIISLSDWAPDTHWSFPCKFRKTIFTLLCIKNELQFVDAMKRHITNSPTPLLPHFSDLLNSIYPVLPDHLWFLIFSFLSFC